MNNKNYTNLEISRELKELGFNGGCDAWWSEYNHTQFNSEYNIILTDTLYEGDYESYKNEIPAFTAQDILDVLQKKYNNTLCLEMEKSRYVIYLANNYTYDTKTPDICYGNTLADALGLMLIELIRKCIVSVK